MTSLHTLTPWPSESFLRSIDIHELLPQQEPFVMISRLVRLDGMHTVSETDVSPDNLFIENGCLSASGLIENIAQTCAARIGYVNKYILQKEVQIGFIGAIRNLEVHALPKTGQTFTTIVDIKEEVFGMTLASAVVKQGTHTLVTTEIKIAVEEKSKE
jgi:predicted hotdog family 3-hydroxylacyl-ACP dehydratase